MTEKKMQGPPQAHKVAEAREKVRQMYAVNTAERAHAEKAIDHALQGNFAAARQELVSLSKSDRNKLVGIFGEAGLLEKP